MVIYLFILIYLILSLIYQINFIDYYKLKEIKLFNQIIEYSYFGIKRKLKKIDNEYNINTYLIEIICTFLILLTMAYYNFVNFKYCLILTIIISFLLPFYRWLNIKRNYNELLDNEILLYASSGIIYIQEGKNSLRILKDLSDLVKGPLKEELLKTISYIEKTADFTGGLNIIENRYPYQVIKKFHVLLLSLKNEGGYNKQLYDYLYQSIEDLELNINSFYIKKKYNRKIFYIMLLMNIFLLLMIKNVFVTNSYLDVNNDTAYFLYYLLNILTTLYYEYYLSRKEVF